MSGQTIHLGMLRDEELKMALSMEKRLLHSRDESIQPNGARRQDTCVTFDRESLKCLTGFFPGDLGAFFTRLGKPDSDGLLAALYAPALATLAGA